MQLEQIAEAAAIGVSAPILAAIAGAVIGEVAFWLLHGDSLLAALAALLN